MIKIGFIDNFLSEWHANNYPEMIRSNAKAKEDGMDVCFAYAKTEVSPYDGVTTDEWCQKYGVMRMNSIEELVDRSDCIVVLSPDNPELHFELSEYALKSGKPTYIDKTFAPDRAEAERIFQVAADNGTPVYSSSSLRFASELEAYRREDCLPKSCIAVGPYLFDIYAIHIFEIICTVMKTGAKRMMAVQNTKNRILLVDYGEERLASFVQMHTDDNGVPFEVSVEMEDGTSRFHMIGEDYFRRFIDALVGFFIDRKPVVPSGETADLMSMLETAKKALASPYTWYSL